MAQRDAVKRLVLRRWQVAQEAPEALRELAHKDPDFAGSGIVSIWAPPWLRFWSRRHAERVARREQARWLRACFLLDLRTGRHLEVGPGPMAHELAPSLGTAVLVFSTGFQLVIFTAEPGSSWLGRLGQGVVLVGAALLVGRNLGSQLEGYRRREGGPRWPREASPKRATDSKT